jgi:hypothetical protein
LSDVLIDAVEHFLFIGVATVKCESVECSLDEAPYVTSVVLNRLKLVPVIPEARCAYLINSLRPGMNTIAVHSSKLPSPEVCAQPNL